MRKTVFLILIFELICFKSVAQQHTDFKELLKMLLSQSFTIKDPVKIKSKFISRHMIKSYDINLKDYSTSHRDYNIYDLKVKNSSSKAIILSGESDGGHRFYLLESGKRGKIQELIILKLNKKKVIDSNKVRLTKRVYSFEDLKIVLKNENYIFNN